MKFVFDENVIRLMKENAFFKRNILTFIIEFFNPNSLCLSRRMIFKSLGVVVDFRVYSKSINISILDLSIPR